MKSEKEKELERRIAELERIIIRRQPFLPPDPGPYPRIPTPLPTPWPQPFPWECPPRPRYPDPEYWC